MNRSKCEFRKDHNEYFGHVISKNGTQPNTAGVSAIRNMTPPTNITELRRIIGMVNYLTRFIPNLANVIKFLTDLLKGSNSWVWDSQRSKLKVPLYGAWPQTFCKKHANNK